MAFNLINFKKGTLAGLNALKQSSGIEEGTFYLTIDQNKQTSRLFIGTGTATALPVNSNIITVSSVQDLEESSSSGYQNPTLFNDGDFAYVTNGNILAVKKGDQWVQINGVDKSKIWKDFTPSVSTSNGTATISWALRNENNTSLKDADGNTPAITMTGANGVTVSSSGKAVTVTGTAYEATSPAVVQDSDEAFIKLQSKSSASGTLTDVSSVRVAAGTNVHITGAKDNIVISAEDTQLDANALTITNRASNGFDISVKDTKNHASTKQLDPVIVLEGHTQTSDQIHFNNGTATLPVYTKDEVDAKLTSVDAMTYKGILNGENLVDQTENVFIGDTFKAGDRYTLPAANSSTGVEVAIKPGDLVIVSSSNGKNEPFKGKTIKYDVIPSGDDFYVFKGLGASHNGNGIQIEDGSSANTILSSIEIKAANNGQMSVSSTHSDGQTTGDGAKTVVNIAHGTISASTNGDANVPTAVSQEQTTHASQTFDVVTGLTTSNGHVTGTTVQRIKVVDTVSQIDTNTSKVTVGATSGAATNTSATVKTTIALKDEKNTAINSKDLEFILKSDNLKITTSGTTITANYVWGTFD